MMCKEEIDPQDMMYYYGVEVNGLTLWVYSFDYEFDGDPNSINTVYFTIDESYADRQADELWIQYERELIEYFQIHFPTGRIIKKAWVEWNR